MQSWKLGVFSLGSLALLVVGAEAARTFRPPTAAVVDIAQVFEQYDKRKTREQALQAETKELELKVKDLEKKYKDVVQELPQIESSERKKELSLQKMQLELEVKWLKEEELGRLRKTQLKYLQELRDEIVEEIKAYAKSQNLDVILEKTVAVEGENPGQGFRWPIVHYAKPEFEITKEIADRLNGRYRESSP